MLEALKDYFVTTQRHEPAGVDWRHASEHVETTQDREYVRRIAEPGWQITEPEKVVQMQPKDDPFNARKVYDQIKQLSVTITGQQNQIDELRRDQAENKEKRRILREQWLREAHRLGCFEELEAEAVKPPAIPTISKSVQENEQ